MNRITRRRALRGGGTAAAGALAGCAGRDPSGDGSDSPDSGDDDSGSDGEVTTAIHQVGTALSGPAWSRDDAPGLVVLLAESSDADPLFADAPAETRGFLEATDFAISVLAYVESVGPTTCDSVIEFDAVTARDGTLSAEATVVSTADDTAACGEAITFSGALLRVTADPRPDAIRITVTNGWDEHAELTGTDDPASPSAVDAAGVDGDRRETGGRA